MIKIYKVLTKNDTGETHSHQSGITIPKKVAESGIFPDLGTEILNPREEVVFFDENGTKYLFQYIYYNDVFFGKPKHQAHNEHRLTCVKDFIRNNNIKSGDSIWFAIDENNVRHIGFEKAEIETKEPRTFIKLTGGWKYIKI